MSCLFLTYKCLCRQSRPHLTSNLVADKIHSQHTHLPTPTFLPHPYYPYCLLLSLGPRLVPTASLIQTVTCPFSPTVKQFSSLHCRHLPLLPPKDNSVFNSVGILSQLWYDHRDLCISATIVVILQFEERPITRMARNLSSRQSGGPEAGSGRSILLVSPYCN